VQDARAGGHQAVGMTAILPPITVLGAGRIGTALAKTLHRAGHPTTVWNRSPERLAGFDAGIRSEPDLLRALGGAAVVVIAVSTYSAARELLAADGVADALATSVVVQLTSGTPHDARDLGAWAHARGITVVDGAIMVTPDLIGTERCVVLYAGDQAAFESTPWTGRPRDSRWRRSRRCLCARRRPDREPMGRRVRGHPRRGTV
jgi:3-hydroxyisobutyrate dehydrogenase-like beta-hydroxyacid dehydrogenase